MPLCCVSAASTSCYSLRTSSSLRVVRCQSSLSSPTNGGGQNGLQTDFPVILVEESPTRMTSIPVLSLKTATGQVKAGDVVRNSLVSPLPDFATDTLETVAVSSDIAKGAFSKIDKSGRFCKPRAARELALMVAYAACLEGSDPLFVFGRRLNAKQVPGYAFDKASLLQYDHMSFAGEPIQVETEEEAEELLQKNEKESTNEAEVLSAPIKLVYSKFVLRFAKDIIGAVVNQWNQHVTIIEKIIPQKWKDEPGARILELCILHMAMSEITELGTRHQIVINEAVDLAKRFCDGSAPRIINGCLRTFIKERG
ncbi:hypothetical protein HPP92_027714 [Vanilla planifolia]|uniref:NusB/RsmB/TIM44 domain-containing protein n=1 Tax=Vanilla planifolia TaxID=51239 RepID=A0A835U4Q6_VANPL|nr:hypothetical protein HPP92_027714 [Vanilla planifolia]